MPYLAAWSLRDGKVVGALPAAAPGSLAKPIQSLPGFVSHSKTRTTSLLKPALLCLLTPDQACSSSQLTQQRCTYLKVGVSVFAHAPT